MKQIPIERREEAIPEGYVKVVRCKDCKFATPEEVGIITFNNVYHNRWDYWCKRLRLASCADDYCSRGERKDKTEC